MKHTVILLATLFFTAASGNLFAQNTKEPGKATHHIHQASCNKCQHHQTKSDIPTLQQSSKTQKKDIDALIATIFPKMNKVERDKIWNQVFDENGSVIGYITISPSGCDSIRGYAGPTPLLIAFNQDKTILAVHMLANKETPKFKKIIYDSKLLESWNGLTVKKAKKKKVDTVSGATYTSRSIISTFLATLKTL